MKKLDKHVGNVFMAVSYALQIFLLVVAMVCFMAHNTHACDISLILFWTMACIEYIVDKKLIDKE